MNDQEGKQDEMTFERVLQDLTQVVEKLERGNLPLERSIELYEQGLELLKKARGVLEQAKAKLEVLMPDGQGGVTGREVDPHDFLDE